VLIVDDNTTNRRILEDLLRSWEMEPVTASHAREALQILRQAKGSDRPIRLIISDVHMPEMDGFDLATAVRQDAALRATPIMMLSSGTGTQDTARCRALQIAARLTKPVKQSELLEAVVLTLHGNATIEEAALPPPVVPAAPPRALHVLLAEDSVVNQKLAVGLLRKRGHAVTIANDGEEAIRLFRAQTFDMVLMDVEMPHLDGLNATQAIRDHERQAGTHIPIIAMTAHAMKGDREKCLAAGMDGYVSKPVRQKDIFEAIGQFFPELRPSG
jgi:CheY-like chemotaxis protein